MEEKNDLKSWLAGSLRLSIFYGADLDLEKIPKWKDATGETPDNQISHPKIGVYQESGKFADGSLTMNIGPSRVDWLYSPLIKSEAAFDSFPNVGEISRATEHFKSFALSWLKSLDYLTRMAFGAILIQPTGSQEEAYRKLAKYLHFVNIDPTSSDFSYSINRPRDTAIGITGLKINRLSKWRAITMILSVDDTMKKVDFACNLELDINTIPDEKARIEKEMICPIFEELVSLGTEITEKGDIA